MKANPPAKLVLLIEDNEHNRRIFSGVLKHYGFDVCEAENGQDGVDRARELRPDLILMDLSLPVLDGWEATKQLKDDPTLCDIPVLALTAHAMQGDEQRAIAAGCDGYLSKPISPKSVVHEVQRVLGIAPSSAGK